MRPFAIDTETYLISPAHQAPRMVCVSIAENVEHADVLRRKDPRSEARVFELYERALSGDAVLVGANIAFDLAVFANEWPELLAPTFELLEADRIFDVLLRQKMLDNARGVLPFYTKPDGTRGRYKYNLKEIAERHEYPVVLVKEDSWRLRYKELEDIDVRDWDVEAREYSEHDSKAPLWAFYRQEKQRVEDGKDFLEDQHRQTAYAFALQLVSVWGIRTDRVMVDRYRQLTLSKLKSHEQNLIDAGMVVLEKGKLVKKRKPTQEYAEKAWAASGLVPPRGKTGISCDEDAATLLGDPLLIALQEYGSSQTVLNRCEELAEGVFFPIHTNFDPFLQNGRTASSNPNLQNRQVEPNDRECFVPRRGNVYIDYDFGGLELCTFAQCCKRILGHSRMADVLNADGDPHSMIGAQLLGISLEEMLRRKKNKKDIEAQNARQTGKVGNFGLAGGLGWRVLIEQARAKYKVHLVEESAKRLIQVWHSTWPETYEYFKFVKALVGGEGTVCQLVSNRYRGGLGFTDAANTFFSGLGADATKFGLYALVKATYVGSSANLRECRVVNYIHDQYITEAPEEIAHECALEKKRIVEEAANAWLPDVPVKGDPVLCRRWSKLIPDKSPLDQYGRMIPWEWDEAVKVGSLGHAE